VTIGEVLPCLLLAAGVNGDAKRQLVNEEVN